MAFLSSVNWAAAFAFLFALSEVIGTLPSVKASGVFQAIYNTLKWLKETFKPAAPKA